MITLTTRILKYLILLALSLFVVAISSFWLSGPSFREKDVVFELEGPTQTSAGDEVIYRLKYSNQTRTVLRNLKLSFSYPDGSVVIVENQTRQNYTESFTVESLSPGQNGGKEFRAFLTGERGDAKMAKAMLSFEAGNIKSSFEKESILSTTIIASSVSLVLVAPPNVAAGQTIEYILDYRNGSQEDISNIIFELDYPDDFKPTEFSPLPQRGNNLWQVDILRKNTGSRISIKGNMGGSEGENKLALAKLKRKIGNDYIDYQLTSVATIISNPVFQISILVNNSPDYSASLGDRLNYLIKYKNSSNFNLSGVNLSVKLEGDMFDLLNLDTRGGFFDDSNDTIVWDSSVIPGFSNFSTGARGQVNFTVPIKSSFSSLISGSSRDRFVKVSAKLSTSNIPAGTDVKEIMTSTSLITKIGIQPSFNQLVYYNDQNFGPSGPLPPRVGEETVFTFHWQLANPGNDAKNVKITAQVPEGAFWVDALKTDQDDLPLPTFDSSSSQISWDISNLPYGAGISGEKYEAIFRIKIKPTASQKENAVFLLEDIQFSGTDSFTGQSIIINKPNVSTNNLTDRPEEGVVQ